MAAATRLCAVIVSIYCLATASPLKRCFCVGAILLTFGSGIRGILPKRSIDLVRPSGPIVVLTEWTAVDSLVCFSISGKSTLSFTMHSAYNRAVALAKR